jgi:hypothetical protein
MEVSRGRINQDDRVPAMWDNGGAVKMGECFTLVVVNIQVILIIMVVMATAAT